MVVVRLGVLNERSVEKSVIYQHMYHTLSYVRAYTCMVSKRTQV